LNNTHDSSIPERERERERMSGRASLTEKAREFLAEKEQFKNILYQSCQQRNQFYLALVRTRLANTGSPRYEGNPFLMSAILNEPTSLLTYTQQQLDMRRKVEVLQYAGASTQGGKQESNVQQFSRINRMYNTRTAQLKTNADCSSNKYIPRATTDSNVPGPPQLLVYDPNVELYNYKGLQQNMPLQNMPFEKLPTFDAVLSGSNSSVVRYHPFSYDVQDVSFVPLSMGSVTFITLPAQKRLNATVTFDLKVAFRYTVIDTVLAPTLTKVHRLFLRIESMNPEVYYFSDPQRFDSTYAILIHPSRTDVQKKDISTDILLPGNFERIIEYTNTSLSFGVNNVVNYVQALHQQTDRLSLNLGFKLVAYDEFNSQINPALKINVTGMSISFNIDPSSLSITEQV